MFLQSYISTSVNALSTLAALRLEDNPSEAIYKSVEEKQDKFVSGLLERIRAHVQEGQPNHIFTTQELEREAIQDFRYGIGSLQTAIANWCSLVVSVPRSKPLHTCFESLTNLSQYCDRLLGHNKLIHVITALDYQFLSALDQLCASGMCWHGPGKALCDSVTGDYVVGLNSDGTLRTNGSALFAVGSFNPMEDVSIAQTCMMAKMLEGTDTNDLAWKEFSDTTYFATPATEHLHRALRLKGNPKTANQFIGELFIAWGCLAQGDDGQISLNSFSQAFNNPRTMGMLHQPTSDEIKYFRSMCNTLRQKETRKRSGGLQGMRLN